MIRRAVALAVVILLLAAVMMMALLTVRHFARQILPGSTAVT